MKSEEIRKKAQTLVELPARLIDVYQVAQWALEALDVLERIAGLGINGDLEEYASNTARDFLEGGEKDG